MSKLWSKGVEASDIVDSFTVGADRVLDMKLAKYDVMGSKAHAAMLATIGLLTSEQEKILQEGLTQIAQEIERGEFTLGDEVEDIHSQVEFLLTERLGDIGKMIHSGRSRNDQVLVDLKLMFKDEVEMLRDEIISLFELLQTLSEKHKGVLMPGYTHTQVAMPSSFGLWFGAFAEALVDDMAMLRGAYWVVNQNPLGSAAGYGSSFPLDRDMTTELLGFEQMNYNVIAAQMSRGKSERAISLALSQVASTINRLASDCCLYISANYGFISHPESLTTGSSIMPHKKNPDVWEIIRGKCNRLQSLPVEVAMMTTNMMTGYHRDYQLLKDVVFPALESAHSVLKMAHFMLESIEVKGDILNDKKYTYLFTVEEVNRLVLDGMPFRNAYRTVGEQVQRGEFHFEGEVNHTHKGSIGNLCTEEIAQKMDKVKF
ncbi:MAG: argininosuccinate lyase [Rikenellaceae bacterium]